MKRHFLKLFSTALTIVIVFTSLFGQSWTEHTIDGSFDATRSVYAVDVDGDGDMDVLGAASVDDYIVGGKTMAAPLTTREVTATPGQ